MDASAKTIVNAFKKYGIDCGVDEEPLITRVCNGFLCSLHGKEFQVCVFFIISKQDGSVCSELRFSYGDGNDVVCRDVEKGLQVCNRLNNYTNLFYTFALMQNSNVLFAKCPFPSFINKGKFALFLYSVAASHMEELILPELGKCI